MCRPSFFGEPGCGPRVPIEPSLEVATADEQQLSIDPNTVKCATVELGYGTRAGPLVGKDDHAHPHR